MQSPEAVWLTLADLHAKSAAQSIQRVQQSQALRQRSSELFSRSSGVAELVHNWNQQGLSRPASQPDSGNSQLVLHPFEAYFQASTIAQAVVDLPIYGVVGGIVGYRSASWIGVRLNIPALGLRWIRFPATVLTALSFAQWRAKRGITHMINTSLLFPESPLSNASREVVAKIPMRSETAKADRYYRRFFAAAVAFAETTGGSSLGMGFGDGFQGLPQGLPQDGSGFNEEDITVQPDMWQPEPEPMPHEESEVGEVIDGFPERTFDKGKSWEDIRRGK